VWYWYSLFEKWIIIVVRVIVSVKIKGRIVKNWVAFWGIIIGIEDWWKWCYCFLTIGLGWLGFINTSS
jgi:hypothetical protein